LHGKQGNNPVSDLLETRSFRPLADALRERAATIVARWESLVRDVLPTADDLTLTQVRDEIPATLARLADALESGVPEQTRLLRGQTNAHGEERFVQGYNIEELIVEYRLLRRVLVEEVESALNRRTTLAEDLVLSMGVDTVLQQGVITFVNHQRAELSAAADAEEKFMAYLSHDLRNQLNHINLVLEILTTKLDDVPQVAENVEDIQSARGTISDTVDGMERLLKATRLRKGIAEVTSGPVDLGEMVNAIRRGFFREAGEKGLKLVANVPPGARCETDRRLLMLVLHNLLGNAIKYSDRGTVSIGVTCDEGGWSLSVADEGPGIPPEQRDAVFKEFVRGETHGRPGLGLGLAIASRAAKLLGATLSLESTPGVGSVFTLTHPATKAD
jgi:signal transduction histidine kinase